MLEYSVRLQNDHWVVEIDRAAMVYVCDERADALEHATRLAVSAWIVDRLPTIVIVYERGEFKTVALFESRRQPEVA